MGLVELLDVELGTILTLASLLAAAAFEVTTEALVTVVEAGALSVDLLLLLKEVVEVDGFVEVGDFTVVDNFAVVDDFTAVEDFVVIKDLVVVDDLAGEETLF